jgi:hypothetical protein
VASFRFALSGFAAADAGPPIDPGTLDVAPRQMEPDEVERQFR